ncbi:MAG: RNA polymerase sigma factor [Niastella sp.]|uniref:RNA polymerase sigma factor n=1 Tax=Niastella sp. TaxID=1869183 RepID=UPI00389AB9E3
MKDEQIDDVALLRGINSRDEFMVNAFYKQVFQKLSEVAHRYLDDKHDACDAVTDVFLAFLAEEVKYESLPHIEGLLYIRVRWASLDKLKALKRDNRHREATDLEDVSVTENSIEDDIVRVEHDHAIKEIIATLPPRYRLVLEQLFFEGKQNPDVARILNANDNVVYIIKNRAIKKLKAILSDKNLIIILLLFFSPD